MLALYSLFLIIAVPLTGFVALAVKHQRDSLRREQEEYQRRWKKAATYKSLYAFPPERLL